MTANWNLFGFFWSGSYLLSHTIWWCFLGFYKCWWFWNICWLSTFLPFAGEWHLFCLSLKWYLTPSSLCRLWTPLTMHRLSWFEVVSLKSKFSNRHLFLYHHTFTYLLAKMICEIPPFALACVSNKIQEEMIPALKELQLTYLWGKDWLQFCTRLRRAVYGCSRSLWGRESSSLGCFTVYDGFFLFLCVLWDIGIIVSFNQEKEADTLRSCVIQLRSHQLRTQTGLLVLNPGHFSVGSLFDSVKGQVSGLDSLEFLIVLNSNNCIYSCLSLPLSH